MCNDGKGTHDVERIQSPGALFAVVAYVIFAVYATSSYIKQFKASKEQYRFLYYKGYSSISSSPTVTLVAPQPDRVVVMG